MINWSLFTTAKRRWLRKNVKRNFWCIFALCDEYFPKNSLDNEQQYQASLQKVSNFVSDFMLNLIYA